MAVTQRRRVPPLLRYAERVCRGHRPLCRQPPNQPGAGDKTVALMCVLPTQFPEGATAPVLMGMAVTEAVLPPTRMPEQCVTLSRHSDGPSCPHSRTRSGPIHLRSQEATPPAETGCHPTGHQNAACLNPGVMGRPTSLGKSGLRLRNVDEERPIWGLALWSSQTPGALLSIDSEKQAGHPQNQSGQCPVSSPMNQCVL